MNDESEMKCQKSVTRRLAFLLLIFDFSFSIF